MGGTIIPLREPDKAGSNRYGAGGGKEHHPELDGEGLAVQAGAKGGVPGRFDDPEIVGEQGPGARGRDHAEV